MDDSSLIRKTGVLRDEQKPGLEALLFPQFTEGDQINGRFCVLEKVGEGGFGVVYRGKDLLSNNQVALKFLFPRLSLDKETLGRIQREIRISQKIVDERIARIFSLEKWEHGYFFVMEYIQGINLKDLIKKRGKIDWKEFFPIYREILGGVQILHRHNIVHRDLKPSNIIINLEGKIKILDFGLAKELTGKQLSQTMDGIKGTPEFMAPEQIRNGVIDCTTDIYQLGLILYQALTGTHPFQKNSGLDILLKHLSPKGREISIEKEKAPKFINFIIRKSLNIAQRDRFADIEEIIEIIKRQHVSFLKRCWEKIKKKIFRNGIILLFCMSLVFVLFLLVKSNRTLCRLESDRNVLTAKNKFGFIIWKRDFSPYNINYHNLVKLDKPFWNSRNINPLTRENKVIMTIQDRYPNADYSAKIPLNSTGFDNRIEFLNTEGKTVYSDSLSNYFALHSYFFSKHYVLQNIMDIDDNNVEQILVIQHYSMFPSLLVLVRDSDLRTYGFYNPGRFFYYSRIQSDNQSARYLVGGTNNLMGHLNYFAEINFDRSFSGLSENIILSGINSIPNLNASRAADFLGFLYFLPNHLYLRENNWKDRGELILVNKKTKDILTLNRDYQLTIRKGSNEIICHDTELILRRAYSLINEYYQTRVLKKDIRKAYAIINDLLKISVYNPYLKSVMYFFKGDLEISLENFNQARESLLKALELYPHITDAYQKLCEIQVLTNQTQQAIKMAREKMDIHKSFWGLGCGNELFRYYCHLHLGHFVTAEEISKFKIIIPTGRKFIIEGIIYLHTGDYSRTVDLMNFSPMKKLTPFSLAEYRLYYARALLLKNLFATDPDQVEMDKAEFFFKDIKENPLIFDYAAWMSYYFFQVQKKDYLIKKDHIKEQFNELLKKSRIDLFTKFWLFYDAFIYGKTMEFLADKKEALRGYNLCIKFNPSTDLAKRASEIIKAKYDQ